MSHVIGLVFFKKITLGKTFVGTKMNAKTPVRSCNFLCEMIAVWTTVAVLKVSGIKLILWS